MSIGAGILLIVIGAVLSFAVDDNLGGGFADLNLIGYILMAAGVLIAILGTIFMFRKRTSVTAVQSSVDPATGDRVDRRETVQSPPTPPVT